MKKTLNKLFKKTNIEMILVALGVLLSIQFLIFPGLTAPNTLMNMAAGLGALVLALFLYYYLLPSEEPIQEIEQGETELDYIPQEEIVKKKRTYKKKTESHIVHPKVKTKKK
jgi:hypothetical protein